MCKLWHSIDVFSRVMLNVIYLFLIHKVTLCSLYSNVWPNMSTTRYDLSLNLVIGDIIVLLQLIDVVEYHAEHFVPFIRKSLEVTVLFNFTPHGNGSMLLTVYFVLQIFAQQFVINLCI